MIRARVFAIPCGYEDGNDLDHLRDDPVFKLACSQLPDTDRDLSPANQLRAGRHLDGQLRVAERDYA